jgi:O-antigen ligase
VTASAPASVARTTARPRSGPKPSGPPSNLGYWLFVIFLVLEIDRPPVLPALKLQMGIAIVLPLMWLSAREKPWSPVLTAQLLVFLACAATIPLAVNNYAAYFTTRTLFSTVGLGIAISWLFAGRDAMRRFYWTWLLVISWVAFFGITHGGIGPGGFIGDENDLALACVGTFPFAFYGFQLLPRSKRIAAGVLGFALVLCIVSTSSRGGFVGLVAVLIYCFVMSANKIRNFLVAAVAACAFLAMVPQSYLDDMATIQNTDTGTADARQFLWATAWNVWKANPILGVGAGNFNYVAGNYAPRDDPRWQTPDYLERNWSGTTVHSSYFQILSELGIVGAAAYAFMIFGHFRSIGRLRKQIRRRNDLPQELRNEIELYGGSLSAGMIGTLASGAFLSAVFYPYAYFFAGAGVALVAWGSRALADSPVPVAKTKPT